MRQAKAWIGRKYVWLAAALLLMMAVCVSAAAETYPFTSVATVKVNMRRSASSTAALVDRIPEGASVTVVGSKGNYYKVEYNGQSGYVMKEFISSAAGDVATPTPMVTPTATGYPYDTVTTSSVNLRAKQSVNSEKLTTIPKGAAITVHKVSGTFAQVTYNGQDGYVKTDYIQLKTIVKATATPSPTPVIATVAPEENASGYQVLMQGSTGAQVKALQQALTELGFLSGTADGIFGKGTENAVIAFQSANSYPATGIVDANLQAFLYSGTPKNAKGVKTEVKTLAPVNGVTIRLNDQGDLVGTVQTRLQELGYYTGEITCVYDKTTQTALKAFQKKNGLTADGVCGTETQGKLLGGFALSANATATPTAPAPTATPSPAPTFQVPAATVRQGDTGDDVKLVQQRLKDLGYYTGTVDGKFGSGSVAALITFQTKNGLNADGVAGSGTYALLFSYGALAFSQTPTPSPEAIPTPAPVTSYPPITQENVVKISLGVTDPQVTRLQNRLTLLGYYTANPDGTCKADDVAAIKAFQKKNGLTADGVAGYNTQVKLYSQSAITYSGAIAGGTVEAFTTLQKGDSGDAVAAMQQRLIDLGYLSGTADGKFGTATAEAVYAFQKANGLVRDAKAGSQTLSLLYSATVSAAPTATPVPTPSLTSTHTLRQGDVSDAVVLMQQRLITLGYLAGDADGNFGVLTYRALQAFQKANGLTVDGIAGKQTLAALSSANAAANPGTDATPAPTATPGFSTATSRLTAANVVYQNWYSSVRAQAKIYQYATVYDFSTGISWQVHMFSFGNHAEVEPLTAADTAKMEQAFGGNTWNPKAVWVLFGDGTVYMASTHSMPHEVQHITDNNFAGHACIHFPRTDAQVAAIGSYATSHQKCIDAGWQLTQSMIR